MADCGCDFAGTDGEMCPEALVLAKACEEAYRRWLQLRQRARVDREPIANEVEAAEDAYDAAVEAYRKHMEAVG